MNKTWVVGGTSGIGESCYNLLYEMFGEDVIKSGHVDADVRSQDALFAFLAGQHPGNGSGHVTHLVYSAGINEMAWSMNINPDRMLNAYDVNVVGLVRVLQLLPNLERCVVIGSDAAWREMRTSAMYCASKAALHQVVKIIARERASDKFAINVVAPGMTEPTKMQEYIDKEVPAIGGWTDDEAREYEKSQMPMGRRAHVDEIASVALSVLLMPTNYLNGAIIPVNGGR